MSGICGWVSTPSPSSESKHLAEQMADRLSLHPGSPVSAHCHEAVAVATRGSAVQLGQHENILVAIQGCPVWAENTPAEWLNQAQFTAACASAFRRAGPSFLEHLNGQFAIAIIASTTQEILLAVDRTGTENLCYSDTPEALVFASAADAVLAHPSVNRDLNPQAIFDYIYFHVVPGPGTVYRNVERLLPGHYLHGTKDSYSIQQYWKPEYRRITYESFDERKSTLRSLLHQSVSDSICADQVGAFLSGGTDSSTVAGVLSEVLGRGARTYSIGFDAPGYDESEYARVAAKHFGTQHREYYVTPDDVVNAIPTMARAFDMPFGNASAVPAYYCAKLAAEDGVTNLLGGDGGDEVFGGNARYAKQWIFSLYEQVPQILRSRVLEPGLESLPAKGPMRKLQSYVAQANVGMPDRIESYNLLTRLGPANVFDAAFLDSVRTEQPIELVRAIYHSANADDTLNRMLALDMRITLADNDLRKVTRACDAAGISATFPLLDRRLMEFAQHLPSDWKVKRTRLRDFFKRALSDFLPSQVITKSKHGFGLPFGLWMQTDPKLRELAQESLTQLRNRNIFRSTFIDELTSTHVEQHAAYYGTMVWILIMLEQWLQSREI